MCCLGFWNVFDIIACIEAYIVYESQSQWISRNKERRYCSVISGIERLVSSVSCKPEATFIRYIHSLHIRY
jgi:hypothetical protein